LLVPQEPAATRANWALAQWDRQYQAGEKPTALKLKKQFNEIRREQFPWTWEVTKNASDQPMLDLGKAFTAFFEGRALASKAKSEAKPASISRTINSTWAIIAFGYPSSDGSTWRRICVSKAR
jgi:transposase